MQESTIVKIVAIASLTLLEIINMLTMKIDGNVLLTVGSIIGGIAGYELAKHRPKGEEEEASKKEGGKEGG